MPKGINDLRKKKAGRCSSSFSIHTERAELMPLQVVGKRHRHLG